jgi:hypothetical protein
MDKGSGHRDKFCDDILGAMPPQRLAFPVGRPDYLSDSSNADQELAMENGDEGTIICTKAIFPADPGESTQAAAFWKLHDKFPQSLPHEILRDIQRNEIRLHRT